ncbi:hypothetical protein JCM9279_005852 [Rhodotorula babjevae]
MASTSGLSRRRAVPSSSSASSPPAAGGTSSLSALSTSQGQARPSSPAAISTPTAGHKIAYDERDLGDVEEDRINPRLTLMEEVLLLGLKDKQGYLSFWNDNISYTLRGCIVLELALRHRIAMVRDPGRRRFPLADRYIEVVDDRLTGEVLLDEALKMMKGSERMSVGTWIDLMSGETWNVMKIGYQLKQVRERLAKGLVDKGVLRTEKRNFLLFDMATHPVSDPAFKDDVLRRTLGLLTARTAAVPTSHLYGDAVRYRTVRAVAMVCAAFAANVLENALVHLGYDQRENAFAKADELLADFSQWPFGAYREGGDLGGGGGGPGGAGAAGGRPRPSGIATGGSAASAESANLAEIMRLARLEIVGQGSGDEPGDAERQTMRELHLEVVAACIEVFRRIGSVLCSPLLGASGSFAGDRTLPPPGDSPPFTPVQRRTWLNPLPRQIPVVDRLLKLPLELVYIVLSFLDPPSLLALTCTSRPWAALLRRPSSNTHERTMGVWAQARINARVPQLESDLAGGDNGEIAHEVLLARLLGGWACQVCGGPAARDEDVDFDARVRLCSTCRTSMLATTQELSDAYFHLHPRTLDCVFRTSTHDPNVHHPQFEYRYFVPDALAVSAHLYFLEAEALAQGKQPAEVVDDCVERRLGLRTQVRRDADKLKGWWKVRDKDRGQEQLRRLERRHRSVFAKLDELDFDEIDHDQLFEISYDGALWMPPSPNETSSQAGERERLNDDLDRFFTTMDPLTDQEWRDWKPRVVAFASERRRERRDQTRELTSKELSPLHGLVKLCVGIEAAPFVPPYNSFLRLPSLTALWADGEQYPYLYEVEVVLPDAIADTIEAMRTDRLVLLVRLARTLRAEGDPLPSSIHLALDSSPSPFADRNPRTGVEPAYLAIDPADVDDVLELATALFRCGICGLLAPVAQLVPHVHASQGSRAPPRCIIAPAQMQRGFVGVTVLELGPTLRRSTLEGPGAPPAPPSPSTAAGEGKKRRLLGFDAGEFTYLGGGCART